MAVTGLRPHNPYVAGNPVGGSRAFVGREDVLRYVHAALSAPQGSGVVLFGQRRIGKTSILLHLRASLRADSYRAVYVDLQDKTTWSLGDVLVDLARSIAAALNLPPPVPKGEPDQWFAGAWLPSILAGLPAQASLVILFDEFDVLADVKAEHAAAALFPYLRQIMNAGDRVRLVFVIGRNVADLANIAHSLFKALPAERVGLLAREDAEKVMRMSETDGTMAWDTSAIEAAWSLTSGHPFLLQTLCFELWESASSSGTGSALVTAQDVAQRAPRALQRASNAFEWLWKGLPPAARVVASALASGGPRALAQEQIEQLLHESGVRVVFRELREAPQLLLDWDLIETTEGGYRFRVELLRQWIATFKPLLRVQKELDYVEPLAELYYGIGEQHYNKGEPDRAVAQLRQALDINPNHSRASELLADILISQQQWAEARRVLEQLYEHNPSAARARLVQVLLRFVEDTESEDDKLALLDHILTLQRHPAVESARRRIWVDRGRRAHERGRLEEAIAAYGKGGETELETSTRRELALRACDADKEAIAGLEKEERFAEAYARLQKLASDHPALAWRYASSM